MLKTWGTTLNGQEEGGKYYIAQKCDLQRFEAKKGSFPLKSLNIFATGCSKQWSCKTEKQGDQPNERN